MEAGFKTEQRQKLGLYKLGDNLHFPGHQKNTTKILAISCSGNHLAFFHSKEH